MSKKSDIFEKNYRDYCDRIADLDFGILKDRLGIKMAGENLIVPFFGKNYLISKHGILNEAGKRPNYMSSVILFKYLLLAPDRPYSEPEWISFKDFKQTSNVTNVNYYKSDIEKPIIDRFSGRLKELYRACEKFGGIDGDIGTSHDLAIQFVALPKIKLLLLFSDGDEEFPAQCPVLFQKQAERYLDPESLAMTSAFLAKSLREI
jgi:hypothetical protein